VAKQVKFSRPQEGIGTDEQVENRDSDEVSKIDKLGNKGGMAPEACQIRGVANLSGPTLCLSNRGTFSIWLCIGNAFASLVNWVGLSHGEA
jgi:hypothetical protein